jgi:hypothetical protein
MSGRRDKVQQGVHTLVLETRVPSDPGFFGEDMVVLQFEVRQDFLKAAGTDETTKVIWLGYTDTFD